MSRSPSTSRRNFLRSSLLTTAVFGAPTVQADDRPREASENSGRAKNVIFMVSDGMNHGALSLANEFRGLVDGGKTEWMKLYRERNVVRSLMETFSASSIVTDSAAAASAWGGGKRVANGTLNVDDKGTPLTPLHLKVQAAGKRTGLVSTATITHATPAGFAANVDNRGKEAEIAQQYLDRRVDVLLGGGRKNFSPELRAAYAAAGYDIVENRDALLKLDNSALKPVLGLFADSYHPFTIDRKNVPGLSDTLPSLSGMTRTALERLSHAKDGFFLMVEGARIDHAGHANDPAASIHDQLAFDDAIGVVREWIAKNPDTLLIITTDHGCGGIQMNGVSADANQGFAPGMYNASTHCFRQLTKFTRSFEWMKQNQVDGLNGPKLGEALEQYTGFKLNADEIKAAQGLKMGDIMKRNTGIGWTSGNHTGELVEFCASGPGSHLFAPFLWNYEIHDLLLRSMEIA